MLFDTITTQQALHDLADNIGLRLNAKGQSIYLEAVYLSKITPCTAEQILTAWLAIVAKGGIPYPIRNYVNKA